MVAREYVGMVHEGPWVHQAAAVEIVLCDPILPSHGRDIEAGKAGKWGTPRPSDVEMKATLPSAAEVPQQPGHTAWDLGTRTAGLLGAYRAGRVDLEGHEGARRGPRPWAPEVPYEP